MGESRRARWAGGGARGTVTPLKPHTGWAEAAQITRATKTVGDIIRAKPGFNPRIGGKVQSREAREGNSIMDQSE